MGGRHHYVSQFHLRGFTDPTVKGAEEPWLWVGDCAERTIVRRSPRNTGWSRDLFDGPGGLQDRNASVEDFLSTEIESPAAFALRGFVSRPSGKRSAIPGEVSRYLAWAAARNLPMRQLYQAWSDNLPYLSDADYAEPPPDGFEQIRPVSRFHRMEHPTQGMRDDVSSDQVESMRRQGWRLLLGRNDFLELVHLQAWYLQVRFFPRMQWIILDAPPGRFFVLADRAVVWGFADRYDVAPSTLRLPNVQLLAPLTRSIALFAFNPLGQPPEMITPLDVNRIMASAAHQWIAGPTRETVSEALSQRGYA